MIKQLKSFEWYWLILAIPVTVTAIVLCSYLHERNSKELVENIQEVVLADACNISGQNCIRNVVLIRGGIDGDTLDLMQTFINNTRNVDIDTVCFSSKGGNIIKAETVSEIIKKANLSTCVAEKYIIHERDETILNPMCGSICNFLLLSSAKRIAVGMKFEIVSHSIGLNLSTCICNVPINGSWLNGFKLTPFVEYEGNKDLEKHKEFIKNLFKIPFSKKRTLTKKELVDYAFFTEFRN